METTTCRACGKRIFFAKTPAGKAIPLNAEPDPAGNVALRDGLAVVLGGEALAAARATGEELRTSHFADCPAAARFRKAR